MRLAAALSPRRAAALAAVGLAVAACSFGGPTAGTSLAPTPEPAIADRLGVRCMGGLPFDPALLGLPAVAETQGDAAGDALRGYISQNAAFGVPPTGWVRVAQTDQRVEFLARSPDGTTWEQLAFTGAGGGWTFAEGGPCDLEVVAPDGTGRAEWWIDPSFPTPRATDTTIHLQILELECAGGQPPIGRVEAPLVSLTPTEARIAIFVRRQPGDHECPGNPPLSVEVELPEPLGARSLLDAGVFPPRAPILPSG